MLTFVSFLLAITLVAAQLPSNLHGSYTGTINMAGFVPVMNQIGIFQNAFLCGTYNSTTQGTLKKFLNLSAPVACGPNGNQRYTTSIVGNITTNTMKFDIAPFVDPVNPMGCSRAALKLSATLIGTPTSSNANFSMVLSLQPSPLTPTNPSSLYEMNIGTRCVRFVVVNTNPLTFDVNFEFAASGCLSTTSNAACTQVSAQNPASLSIVSKATISQPFVPVASPRPSPKLSPKASLAPQISSKKNSAEMITFTYSTLVLVILATLFVQ